MKETNKVGGIFIAYVKRSNALYTCALLPFSSRLFFYFCSCSFHLRICRIACATFAVVVAIISAILLLFYFYHAEIAYLFRKPWRHEWHLKCIAVRVQGVKGVGRHGAKHREDTARKLIANCKME